MLVRVLRGQGRLQAQNVKMRHQIKRRKEAMPHHHRARPCKASRHWTPQKPASLLNLTAIPRRVATAMPTSIFHIPRARHGKPVLLICCLRTLSPQLCLGLRLCLAGQKLFTKFTLHQAPSKTRLSALLNQLRNRSYRPQSCLSTFRM